MSKEVQNVPKPCSGEDLKDHFCKLVGFGFKESNVYNMGGKDR